MRYQELNLFPTTLLRVDVSDKISSEDMVKLVSEIDRYCEDPQYLFQEEGIPNYQSKAFLFDDDNMSFVCKKLKQTFLTSCELYLKKVPHLCDRQDKVMPLHTRAWFFKSWKSMDSVKDVLHSHSPAFLSGIFYIKIPTSSETDGGTLFVDPRNGESKFGRKSHVSAIEGSWIIFPGWLQHMSKRCDSDSPRYVIAADLFVKV